MHMVMPWFLPLGVGIGIFGSRTVLGLKRTWGGRWRWDLVLLGLMAWVPVSVWMLVCLLETKMNL